MEDLEKLARWLDSKYETPIGVRVGWDGILGLIPGVGEFVTTILSGYIIVRSAMLGATTSVLLRMGLNVVIDDLIGVVPLLGWMGDFMWKSNLKNIRLLQSHRADPEGTQRRSAWVLGGVVGVVIFAVITFALFVAVMAWLVGVFIYSKLAMN